MGKNDGLSKIFFLNNEKVLKTHSQVTVRVKRDKQILALKKFVSKYKNIFDIEFLVMGKHILFSRKFQPLIS